MKMKKILFVALTMMTVNAAFAQTNKGQIMVGGNAGFSTQSEDDFKTSSIRFAPNVGYFFINNFAGGLRLNMSNTNTTMGDIDTKSSSMMVSPFLRYYFLPATQKMNVFADASYGFGQAKYDNEITETKTKSNAYSISAGPAFFLTPNTALELMLSYTSTKIENQDDRTNVIGFGIGFQIHLPGKK